MPNWVQQRLSEYLKRIQPMISVEMVGITSPPNAAKPPHLPSLINIKPPKRRQIKMPNIQKSDYGCLRLRVKCCLLSIWVISWVWRCKMVQILPWWLVVLMAFRLRYCKQQIFKWSLSELTLPHPLVRIIVIEQLYRAMSLINHHPYRRGG